MTRLPRCKDHAHKVRCGGILEGHGRRRDALAVVVSQGPIEGTCRIVCVFGVVVVVRGCIVVEGSGITSWIDNRVVCQTQAFLSCAYMTRTECAASIP
jgi:hypothetical protein